MEKLDGLDSLLAPHLQAAAHWPLFGQQAVTFHRALKLGRWKTTNKNQKLTQEKRKSALATLLDICLKRRAER